MLDKAKRLLYNTLVSTEGKEPSVYSFDAPPLEFSIDKEASKRVFDLIRLNLGTAALACHKEGYPRPVISGGAIRDAMYGRYPKDVDIFIDVTGQEDEDLSMDDRFHLLVDRMFPQSEGWQYSREDLEQYRKMPDHFIVYTCQQVGQYPIQVIGRADSLISSENPLDFTKDYPYNLIKNVAYDDRIVISPEAMSGFHAKAIQAYGGGYAKANEWYTRICQAHLYGSGIKNCYIPKPFGWVLKRSLKDQTKWDTLKKTVSDFEQEYLRNMPGEQALHAEPLIGLRQDLGNAAGRLRINEWANEAVNELPQEANRIENILGQRLQIVEWDEELPDENP